MFTVLHFFILDTCLIVVVIFPIFRVIRMTVFALFSGEFWGFVTEFVATLVSADAAGDVSYLIDRDVPITVEGPRRCDRHSRICNKKVLNQYVCLFVPLTFDVQTPCSLNC